ncbi:TPA: hypothetical protein ACT195_002315 [Raoultella planticola]
MIKFINSISSANPKIYLNGKISEFWDVLNPRKNNGELFKKSLCVTLTQNPVPFRNRIPA